MPCINAHRIGTLFKIGIGQKLNGEREYIHRKIRRNRIASIRFDWIGILFHANLPFRVTLLQMVARKLVSDDHITLYARMLQVYLAKRFVWAANWCHGKQKCTQTYLILTVCAVLVIGPKWCGTEENEVVLAPATFNSNRIIFVHWSAKSLEPTAVLMDIAHTCKWTHQITAHRLPDAFVCMFARVVPTWVLDTNRALE